MPKRVRFDDAARDALWRGVDQLASAVRITLGPRGRSVVLTHRHAGPTITRDGLAVAQEVELPDPFENIGVQMLREAAQQAGQAAGDGTSTATVLAHAMIGAGMRAVHAGCNPVALNRGLDLAAQEALRALRAIARPVGGHHDLERVARIAAGDRVLGELIAHALERVGRAGVVTVEDGRGTDTTLDVVEGARLEGGLASPYFITDTETMEASLEHPLVALFDGALEQAGDVVPALEHAARLSRPLLLLCGELSDEALAVMVVNRLRGRVPTVGVKLPGIAAHRREALEDVALLTGGTVVGPEMGRAAAHFEPGWFGRARHATASLEQLTLLQGGGRSADLAGRVLALDRELAACRHEGERARLRARLVRLGGGVAVIRAGAVTDVERATRRAQLEDALAATRSAVEEGVVPGGGVALLHAARAVRRLDLGAARNSGRDVLLAGLEAPARQIGENAGENGAEFLERLRAGEGAYGYNARSGRWGDLIEQGIVDPAKVTRCALQSAVSVAGLMLTTEALVVDDGAPAGDAGGEGGGGDPGDDAGDDAA
ncbi:MAG: molecular chaperone GroEL [Candidatus Eisenbacteria bacterium]|nr:molecular chaperone GroEL [Candidatus Eisenbacteria bacterium]